MGVPDDLEAVVSLAEPIRRALYEFVAASVRPVSRDEAADTVGITRQAAAHHLDRLADDGLLDVEYRRLTGRSGPGAGRPAKLYRRSGAVFDVTVPPRRYELAAKILLEGAGGGDRSASEEAARRAGRELGRSGLWEALVKSGYLPVEEAGETRFLNCPFHALREQDRETMCGINLALVEGMVEGAHADAVARLEPEDRYCCVRIRTG